MKGINNLNNRSIAQTAGLAALSYGSLTRILFVLGVSSSIALGLVIRFWFLSQSNFPLNDGGLFYNMVLDLQRSGWILPAYTTYNLDQIPFAYPPFAFYLAGAAQAVTHASLIDVFRFLPLATNVLTIIALAFFARDMLSSRTAAVWAVFTFALLPRSYEWTIMGGGLTRSLGFLFAVLALHQAYLLYTRRNWIHLPLAAVLSGLTAISHIEMAWFLAFSLVLLALFYGRYRSGILYTVIIGCGAVLVSAPWWVTVLMQHGLSPFLMSSGSHGAILDGLMSIIRLEPVTQIVAMVSILGIVACLGRLQFFLPVWLVAIYLLDSRGGATPATVPLALLAGMGMTEIIMPFFGKIGEASLSRHVASRAAGSVVGTFQRLPQLNLIPIALVLFAWQAYSITTGPETFFLTSLTAEDRAEMAWVQNNTPASSRFLVVTGTAWAVDRWSEWFPVLADRKSVATVQGYEWLPGFSIRESNYAVLQACATAGATSIDNWETATKAPFDYIYIPKDAYAWSLANSLLQDPNYVEVHDGPAAMIFHRVTAGPIG
ncbi:MAG: hypothetical protein M1319_04125 [Chloroflexi bacterium]|nr:hypothetical protein [Chloroflexota bacterium]